MRLYLVAKDPWGFYWHVSVSLQDGHFLSLNMHGWAGGDQVEWLGDVTREQWLYILSHRGIGLGVVLNGLSV